MNTLAGVFLVVGSFWILLAAIGIVRLPDLYCRLHASTKAPSLGLLFVFVGAALVVASGLEILETMVAVFFIFLTNPIAAHLLSRNHMNIDKQKN